MYRFLILGFALQLSLFSNTQFRVKPKGHLTFTFRDNFYQKYSNSFLNFNISDLGSADKSIKALKNHAFVDAKYVIELDEHQSIIASQSNSSSRRSLTRIFVSKSSGEEIGSFEGISQYMYPTKFLFHNHVGKEIAYAIFDESKTIVSFYDTNSSEKIGSMQRAFRRNYDRGNHSESLIDYISQPPIYDQNGHVHYPPPNIKITKYDVRKCFVDNGLIYYWDVDLQSDLIAKELLWSFATFVADRFPVSSLFPINQTLKPLDKSVSFSVIPNGYCTMKQEKTASKIYLNSAYFDSMTLHSGKNTHPVNVTSSYLRSAYNISTPNCKMEAIARFFSMGTLFSSLKTLDIYENDKYFGQISGAYTIDSSCPISNPSAEFYIYNKSGNQVCRAYLNALYNKVTLLDKDNLEIGKIQKNCIQNPNQIDYSWDAQIEKTFPHKKLLYFLTIFLCDTYHTS